MTEIKCDICKENKALVRRGHQIHFRMGESLALVELRHEDELSKPGDTLLHEQDICRDCLIKFVTEGANG